MNTLQLLFPDRNSDLKHLLQMIPASCGSPEAIEQNAEWVDLDELVRGSKSTYYLHVTGDSMEELGIYDGDLLVVDRERQPETNDVVVAEISGGYTVKLFKRRERKLFLVPANGKYPTYEVESKDDFAVWGVVTHVLHKFK